MSVFTYCRCCGVGFEATTDDIRRGRWRLCPRCRHDGEAEEARPDPPEPAAEPAASGSARSPRGPPARTGSTGSVRRPVGQGTVP